KTLIRMGPENAAIIKSKLRELLGLLATHPPGSAQQSAQGAAQPGQGAPSAGGQPGQSGAPSRSAAPAQGTLRTEPSRKPSDTGLSHPTAEPPPPAPAP